MSDLEGVKLAPCPLCGSAFKYGQEPHDNYPVAGMFYLYHDYGPLGSDARKCQLEMRGHFDTLEAAADKWNRRSPSPVPAPLPGSGATGWQDIARAPKDGTWVDLWAGDRRIPDVRWLDDVGADDYGDTSGWVDARAQFVLGEDERPEFWMRVERPANPAETQAVEVGK